MAVYFTFSQGALTALAAEKGCFSQTVFKWKPVTWSSRGLRSNGGTMYLHEEKGYPSNTQQPCAVKVNSQICIKDVDSGEAFTFCLVQPDQLDARNGKISILTSLGAALIGKGVGNVVTWKAPSRLRRFEVQSVSQLCSKPT